MSECNHTVSYLDKTACKVHTYQVDAIDCPHCLRVMLENTAVEIERLREKLDRMDGYVADLQRLVKAMPLEYPLRLLPPGMCAIIGNMHGETREAADAAGGDDE